MKTRLGDFEKAVQINPNAVGAHSNLCQALATCPEMERRDVKRAIEMGEASVKLMQTNSTKPGLGLGVAHYVAEDYGAAVSALNKGLEGKPSSRDRGGGFYLAMAHWQLDQEDEAVEWYKKAADWMPTLQPMYQAELRRLRDQAAELMGITEDIPTEEHEESAALEQAT